LKGLFRINQVLGLAQTIVKGQFRYLFGYFFLFSFFGQLDVFMLRMLSNDATVATYGSAFRYYTLIIMALSSAHTVLLPMTQKAGSVSELRGIFRKFTRLVLIFAPVVILGAWASKWIIPIIDTGKYPQAVTVFRILAVSAIFSFALSPHVNLVMRFEKFKFLFLGVASAAVISVGLNIALVPKLGAVGTAISTFISFAYVNGMVYLKAKHLMKHTTTLPGELDYGAKPAEISSPAQNKIPLSVGNLRSFSLKLRAKARELAKRLRRPVIVLALDKFYAKRWRGPAPNNHYFSLRPTPAFFFGPNNRQRYVKALKKYFPGSG
ncbi:MAG TPA: hypothetical protein DCZ43_13165, partial [candidate division Zixibacteria bacterium]|nr:hypothetical protein [candidate division Zixibacteria bacterium]